MDAWRSHHHLRPQPPRPPRPPQPPPQPRPGPPGGPAAAAEAAAAGTNVTLAELAELERRYRLLRRTRRRDSRLLDALRPGSAPSPAAPPLPGAARPRTCTQPAPRPMAPPPQRQQQQRSRIIEKDSALRSAEGTGVRAKVPDESGEQPDRSRPPGPDHCSRRSAGISMKAEEGASAPARAPAPARAEAWAPGWPTGASQRRPTSSDGKCYYCSCPNIRFPFAARPAATPSRASRASVAAPAAPPAAPPVHPSGSECSYKTALESPSSYSASRPGPAGEETLSALLAVLLRRSVRVLKDTLMLAALWTPDACERFQRSSRGLVHACDLLAGAGELNLSASEREIVQADSRCVWSAPWAQLLSRRVAEPLRDDLLALAKRLTAFHEGCARLRYPDPN